MTSTRATKQALIKQLGRYKADTNSTLRQLSDEIGYPITTIQAWLSKKFLPTEENLDNIKIFLASKNYIAQKARMSEKTANNLIMELRTFKEQNALTIIELAEKLGIPEYTISDWLNGIAKPAALSAYRIMQLLNGHTEQPTLFTMENAFSDIFQTIDNHGNLLNLIEVDGVPYTTSRMIADKFNKRHDHVIRDMDEIKRGFPKSGETPEKPYFIESSYIHEQNKQEYREILISKKGCILYMFNIQGYQDEKMLFIESFEKMEQALNETPTQQSAPTPAPTPRIDETPELAYIRSKLTELMAESDLNQLYSDLNQLQTFLTMVKPKQTN
ncbi:TPA: Rha family transcriptional regulator [Streptococcus suis]